MKFITLRCKLPFEEEYYDVVANSDYITFAEVAKGNDICIDENNRSYADYWYVEVYFNKGSKTLGTYAHKEDAEKLLAELLHEIERPYDGTHNIINEKSDKLKNNRVTVVFK